MTILCILSPMIGYQRRWREWSWKWREWEPMWTSWWKDEKDWREKNRKWRGRKRGRERESDKKRGREFECEIWDLQRFCFVVFGVEGRMKNETSTADLQCWCRTVFPLINCHHYVSHTSSVGSMLIQMMGPINGQGLLKCGTCAISNPIATAVISIVNYGKIVCVSSPITCHLPMHCRANSARHR